MLSGHTVISGTVSHDVQVTVEHGGTKTTIATTAGRSLRQVLLDAGLSPYAALTERVNCGGRGLCATCGVRLDGVDGVDDTDGVDDASEADAATSPPDPIHWHDRLADRFGYPRLSCQVTVDRDLRVRLVDDKRVWGGRDTTDG